MPLCRKGRKMLFSLLITLAGWDMWDHLSQVISGTEWREDLRSCCQAGTQQDQGLPNPLDLRPVTLAASKQHPRLCHPSSPHQATASHGFEGWDWGHAEKSLLVFNSIPKYLNYSRLCVKCKSLPNLALRSAK